MLKVVMVVMTLWSDGTTQYDRFDVTDCEATKQKVVDLLVHEHGAQKAMAWCEAEREA